MALDPAFSVVAQKRFPMTYTKTALKKKLDFARSVAASLDAPLKEGIAKRIKALEAELGPWAKAGPHKRARNYALVARRN